MISNVLRIALSITLICGASTVLAEAPQYAKALICQTGPGVATQWKDGVPVTERDKNEITFMFSELNQTKGTARIDGSAGSSSVTMIITQAGVTFMEIPPNGGFLVTTVFANSDSSERLYRVADTRHNYLLGRVAVSQYYGMCIGKF